MTDGRDCRWIEVSPDYRERLQKFECAVPLGGVDLGEGYKYRRGVCYTEYEFEVQSTIRDFRGWNTHTDWAEMCVSREEEERIWSFVWFGVAKGTKKDSEGYYLIGYIARSLKAKGCGFGDSTLEHALTIIKENQKATGRMPLIGTRIDPQNHNSMELFKRHGFIDEGVDPAATDYHRWTKIFGEREN